jgi:hypothetical protein
LWKRRNSFPRINVGLPESVGLRPDCSQLRTVFRWQENNRATCSTV